MEAENYPEAYRKIVNAMKSAGLEMLGDMNYREQDRFKDKDGDVRASLDLDKPSRRARSWMIMKATKDQLDYLHTQEKRRGSFIYNIKGFLKLNYESEKWSEERNEALDAFNEENRPQCRKFRGVSIPPYFPLDCEFDGMEYHHAWDDIILEARERFWLPPLNARTGRRFLNET